MGVLKLCLVWLLCVTGRAEVVRWCLPQPRLARLSLREYRSDAFNVQDTDGRSVLVVASPQKVASTAIGRAMSTIASRVHQAGMSPRRLQGAIDPISGFQVYGTDMILNFAKAGTNWRRVSSPAATGGIGSEVASPGKRARVAGFGPCRDPHNDRLIVGGRECITFMSSMAARGHLINPKEGSRPWMLPDLEPPTMPVHRAIQQYAGADTRLIEGDNSTGMCLSDRSIATTSLEALRRPGPPVILVGRDPASRFLSGLLQKVVQGVRLDSGILPLSVLNFTLGVSVEGSGHKLGLGQLFAFAQIRRHPWGARALAHAWRESHLRAMAACIHQHGVPGKDRQPPIRLTERSRRTIREGILGAAASQEVQAAVSRARRAVLVDRHRALKRWEESMRGHKHTSGIA